MIITCTVDASDALRAFTRLERELPDAVAAGIQETGTLAQGRIRTNTPVDKGRARSSWRRRSLDAGKVVEIFSNVPYINVLEFGGYPVRAASLLSFQPPGSFRRGRAFLGGARPGPRTRRPASVSGLDPTAQPFGRQINANVSTQAPRGIVRLVLRDIDRRELAPIIDRRLTRVIRRVGAT